MREFDLIVIGGGPAGLSAAIIAASEGLKTALVESKHEVGGQAGQSTKIENYLGFARGVTGEELMKRSLEQLHRFHVDLLCPRKVGAVALDGDRRIFTLEDEENIVSKAAICSLGLSYRQLQTPNLGYYMACGVSYGMSAHEPNRGKHCVCIVGGANSAGQAAVHLARNERCDIHLLVRGPTITEGMSSYLIENIDNAPNITVHVNTEVVAVKGEGRLQSVIVQTAGEETTQEIPADHMYIFIGAQPKTMWLNGTVARDKHGFLMTGHHLHEEWTLQRKPLALETSVPGIIAAGDVRLDSTKRVASAVGEGAIAVSVVHAFLKLVESGDNK